MLLEPIMCGWWARLSKGAELAFFTFLVASNGCAAGSQLPCFLEVPVYDPRGNRVQFRITGVVPAEGDQGINLLTTERTRLQVSPRGDRLLFVDSLIRARLQLTLSTGEGSRLKTIKTRVTLLECQQRSSVQYGVLDTGVDVEWSTVTGRVSGCSVVGDWWMRAMPMYEEGPVSDGYINAADGSFRVPVGSREGRHLLVIGKDRNPLKVLGIDVTAGAKNDTGPVDLSNSCPK